MRSVLDVVLAWVFPCVRYAYILLSSMFSKTAYDLLATGEHTHVSAKHARLCTPRHTGRSHCFVKFSQNEFLLIQKLVIYGQLQATVPAAAPWARGQPCTLGVRGTACFDRVVFESPTAGALPFGQSNRQHVHDFFFHRMPNGAVIHIRKVCARIRSTITGLDDNASDQ
jgi:hypothetical protein